MSRPRSEEAALSKDVEQRPERKERISMAQQVRSYTGLDPNYFYYEFDANKPGRIQQALDAGYEYVQNSDGANVFREKHGGKLILMRITKDLRQQDFEAGQRKVNEQIGEKVQAVNDSGSLPDYIPKGDDGRDRDRVATLDMGI
jgi:hypothetical protein